MRFKEYLIEQDTLILNEGKIRDYLKKMHEEDWVMAGLMAAIIGISALTGVGIMYAVEDANRIEAFENKLSIKASKETQESVVEKYKTHLKLKKEAEKVIITYMPVFNGKTVVMNPIATNDSRAVAAYRKSIEELADWYNIKIKE